MTGSKLGGYMDRIKSITFKIINRVVLFVFRIICPVHNNYIVLESEVDYSDNVKAFYDYLIRNDWNKSYKIIWFVKNTSKYDDMPKNVVFTSRQGNGIHWKADYYIAASKFFIYTHQGWLKKRRRNQVAIHTTHSAYQLKKLVPSKKPMSDYALMCSDFVADARYRYFKLPRNHMLVLGMPRIDLLYKHKQCLKDIIPNYSKEKIILAMPTMKKAQNWDDGGFSDDYILNIVRSKNDLLKLNSILKEFNYYLIVKIHHLQDVTVLKMMSCNRIIYLNDEKLLDLGIEVNELLENSDILLTDYSSVFFEYLLLNRPIGFMVADKEEYLRGFYKDNPFEDMPGHKMQSVDDLYIFINNVENGMDVYTEDREKLRDKIFKYQDSDNSMRLIQWIESVNNR